MPAKASQPVVDRRTQVVFGTLVMSMTLASGLLLTLEPGPTVPHVGVTLAQVENLGDRVLPMLFDTRARVEETRWKAIVISDSGALSGSASSIHRAHRNHGLDGLAYHFVLGNGNGATDGMVEMGYRWQYQTPGQFATGGDRARWLNEHAIGICLVGRWNEVGPSEDQVESLVWLVQQLQRRFDIPSHRINVLSEQGDGSIPANFPIAHFRTQLLETASR